MRVFVSSTFVDMQDEREELIKRVFPSIRQLCIERGLDLIDVDLRWGITPGQVTNGQMLQICLDEIDRCRPYFLGILGGRYGSQVDAIDPVLVQRFPYLSGCTGLSVTEIEMLHGALNDPGSAADTRFYLRAVDGEPDPSDQLATLKDRVRTAGLTVREWSGGPDELGELVRRDLIELVERDYPERLPPDPV